MEFALDTEHMSREEMSVMTHPLVERLGQPRFSWGQRSLVDDGETRQRYIAALQAADLQGVEKHTVTPAKAGVQSGELNEISRLLDTGLRRHDGFLRFLTFFDTLLIQFRHSAPEWLYPVRGDEFFSGSLAALR